MSLSGFFLENVAGSRMKRLEEIEKELSADPTSVKSVPESAVRFNIMRNALKRRKELGSTKMSRKAMPQMIGSLVGIFRSFSSLKNNPENPRTEITDEELEELKEYAIKLGCTSIGFTKLDSIYVFQDMAALHDNAIVLTMEMDGPKIAMAPSAPTQAMIHGIYRKLGVASNKIATWFRKRGFSAHSVPPLNGVTLFPPIAEQAGLGYHGYHGLIISPEHGPRVRLSAVYTSAENLPFNKGNDHEWIAEYCALCQKCINKCPPQAILTERIEHEGGLLTYVDQDLCFTEFADNYACSVCLAVCPFSTQEYEVLKQIVMKKNDNDM